MAFSVQVFLGSKLLGGSPIKSNDIDQAITTANNFIMNWDNLIIEQFTSFDEALALDSTVDIVQLIDAPSICINSFHKEVA